MPFLYSITRLQKKKKDLTAVEGFKVTTGCKVLGNAFRNHDQLCLFTKLDLKCHKRLHSAGNNNHVTCGRMELFVTLTPVLNIA